MDLTTVASIAGREQLSSESSTAEVQRTLALAGAVLLLLGLLTGFFVSAAMGGRISADPHAALASHLNALLGAFWIFGVGWTLPMLRFGPVGQRRLAALVIAPNYANWIITAVKACLKVSGVDLGGSAANNGVFVGLLIFVVTPSLAAAVAWLWGFGKARAATPPAP